MRRLVIAAVCCAIFSRFLASARAIDSSDSNNDFPSATVLSPGILSVTDSIEGVAGNGLPDTYLGAFPDEEFSFPTIDENDDSSPLGNGLASAIFNVPVNRDGSIHLAVTGCCDNFDGTHLASGDYDLYVDVFDSRGAPLDSRLLHSTLSPGNIDTFSFEDPAWIRGSFNAYTDNDVSGAGPDPLDYWVFTGLTPGLSYVATTSAAPIPSFIDTVLARLDATGTVEDINDDGGEGVYSQLEGVVPRNGRLYFAVTGYADFGLQGTHSQVGAYTLSVVVDSVPEPTTAWLALLGLAALMWVRVRTHD